LPFAEDAHTGISIFLLSQFLINLSVSNDPICNHTSPIEKFQTSISHILYHHHPFSGMDRPVWKIEDYDQLQKLHEGYASTVFCGVCSLSGKKVALKVYQPDKLHEISKHQLMREARLHVQLNHPNIIKMYCAFKQVSWG
jgi:hypothetical protein